MAENKIISPVIDINAYLGDWPFRPLRHRTPAALRRALQAVGITRALVSPLAAIFRQECCSANSDLMQALRQRGDFLIPLPALNPAYPGWEDDLEEALRARAVGVRLFPNYHEYSLADSAIRAAITRVAARGAAIFISLRMQDERHHHPRMMVPAVPPEEVAALAQALPRARIIACMARYPEAETLLAAHAAGDVIPSEAKNLGEGRRKLRAETQPAPATGVFLDLSGVQGPVGCVDLLAQRFGAERLLVGTGAPLQYPLPAVAKIRASELPADARDQILGMNAASLLGLS